MKWIYNLLAAMAFISMSSNSCDSPHEPCPEDIICTMIFERIDVRVVDENNNPVTLTKAQVTSKHLDNPIDAIAESPAGGPYLIVNDSHKPFLSHTEDREFTFEGWVGEDMVVSEKYLLRHDCCHVQLVEGKETVIAQ